jgi:hypothetical protein
VDEEERAREASDEQPLARRERLGEVHAGAVAGADGAHRRDCGDVVREARRRGGGGGAQARRERAHLARVLGREHDAVDAALERAEERRGRGGVGRDREQRGVEALEFSHQVLGRNLDPLARGGLGDDERRAPARGGDRRGEVGARGEREEAADGGAGRCVGERAVGGDGRGEVGARGAREEAADGGAGRCVGERAVGGDGDGREAAERAPALDERRRGGVEEERGKASFQAGSDDLLRVRAQPDDLGRGGGGGHGAGARGGGGGGTRARGAARRSRCAQHRLGAARDARRFVCGDLRRFVCAWAMNPPPASWRCAPIGLAEELSAVIRNSVCSFRGAAPVEHWPGERNL